MWADSSSHWIDLNIPKIWKNKCRENHGDECELPLKLYNLPNITPTWLVDVDSLALIPGRPDICYVALSYRWGRTAGLQSRKSSVLEFQKPYALSVLMSQIPETIRNAIEVVKLLGERYLWVDTLCISQDDKETKSREIDSMAAIYANAILTIVAAEGGNSDYGLRGLKEISQQRDIDMDTLVVDFGEEYKLINVDVGDGRGKWASSPYFTRGWVFQEYHFSKRRLIF